VDDNKKSEIANQWGSWTLVDSKKAERPKDDFYEQFPSRDVPYDKFPDNAWQKDTEYLAKFVTEAKALGEFMCPLRIHCCYVCYQHFFLFDWYMVA
jgi:hypothetical protein